jgi:hypothetical protein
LVALFVSSYFAALIGDALLVTILYGPRASLVQGVRVSDWKHGILSNGVHVGPLTGLLTFVCWLPLLACTDICTGLFISALRGRPRWHLSFARFVGGSMLLIFCAWLIWRDHFLLIHPIPFAALIGGGAMVWKAIHSLRTDS